MCTPLRTLHSRRAADYFARDIGGKDTGMTNFTNLRYVNETGESGPVDAADSRNPYFGHTPAARKVLTTGMRELRWQDSGGQPRSALFKTLVIAALDPRSDLLVVVAHFSDPQYRVPANAVVLNPDASVNHRIDPLPYVERIISDVPREGAVIRQWPVDAFGDVRVQEGRIVIGLNFDYEWFECRYYDVAARQWQERVYIGRR
jgi:hypothetical protein